MTSCSLFIETSYYGITDFVQPGEGCPGGLERACQGQDPGVKFSKSGPSQVSQQWNFSFFCGHRGPSACCHISLGYRRTLALVSFHSQLSPSLEGLSMLRNLIWMVMLAPEMLSLEP